MVFVVSWTEAEDVMGVSLMELPSKAKCHAWRILCLSVGRMKDAMGYSLGTTCNGLLASMVVEKMLERGGGARAEALLTRHLPTWTSK